MADTDLASIVTVFEATCEADPSSLRKSTIPFTHDRQPNGTIQDSYWIEDGGPVSRSSVTNAGEVRIDRLVVWIARPLAFAGRAQVAALEQLGDTIYRALVAAGTANGWNVEADSRRITMPKNTDLVIASFGFRVDYDFSAAVQ